MNVKAENKICTEKSRGSKSIFLTKYIPLNICQELQYNWTLLVNIFQEASESKIPENIYTRNWDTGIPSWKPDVDN